MKVLLVEDDKKIASFIANGLTQAGFTVDHTLTGESGLALASEHNYDIAIIDIMLPGISGLEVIEKLQARSTSTPILILSAKHEVDDRVTGLRKGGDDYLTKPFAFSELLARLEALVRRHRGAQRPTKLQVGNLMADLLSREVYKGGKLIELQRLEFNLLVCLMENVGMVVSKTLLIEQVWNYNFDPKTNIIETRVCTLRDKLKSDSAGPFINTIRGIGYVLKETA